MIEAIASEALKIKVNASGKISGHDYENRYDLIEALTRTAIADCAKKAVEEWVEENRKSIVAAVRKQISERKSEMVKMFVGATESALKSSFYVSCSLNIKESNS